MPENFSVKKHALLSFIYKSNSEQSFNICQKEDNSCKKSKLTIGNNSNNNDNNNNSNNYNSSNNNSSRNNKTDFSKARNFKAVESSDFFAVDRLPKETKRCNVLTPGLFIYLTFRRSDISAMRGFVETLRH